MEINLLKVSDKEKNVKSRWRKKNITFSEKIDNKHRKLHVRKSKKKQRRNIFKVLKEKTNCQLRKPVKTTLKSKDKIKMFFRQ